MRNATNLLLNHPQKIDCFLTLLSFGLVTLAMAKKIHLINLGFQTYW